MTTRFCFPAVLLAGFSLSGVCAAVPPDTTPSIGTSLLQAAQRQADMVEAQYKAGIATQDEREQAQVALALAKVQVRRLDAQASLERLQQRVKAGVLSASDLLESQLAIADCEVAAKQIVFDQRQGAALRVNELLRAGVVSWAETDAANVVLQTARLDLEQARARYKEQRLAGLKQRVTQAEQRMKAGIGSRANVQKAQTEYDAAKNL